MDPMLSALDELNERMAAFRKSVRRTCLWAAATAYGITYGIMLLLNWSIDFHRHGLFGSHYLVGRLSSSFAAMAAGLVLLGGFLLGRRLIDRRFRDWVVEVAYQHRVDWRLLDVARELGGGSFD